jgi:hypothetical protein
LVPRKQGVKTRESGIRIGNSGKTGFKSTETGNRNANMGFRTREIMASSGACTFNVAKPCYQRKVKKS